MKTGALASCVVVVCVACSSKSGTGDNPDAAPAQGPLVIQTDKGAVRGTPADNGRAFLGIPYAAPPTGDLRWKPPADAAPWVGTRDATAYGSDCSQYDLVRAVPAENSEDCLFVNVFTPVAAPTKPAPVMVFIHGGGFAAGSGSMVTYAGNTLAGNTGVIVVTLNYRLGPFGFLGHSALATEAGKAAAPPYGLLDQRAAMRWVSRNIAAFGGDPGNVTIFGESAGGSSVAAQLTMPGSRGLFHRAILESGVPVREGFATPAQAASQGDDFAKAIGCTDAATALACMRGKSIADVLAALPIRKALFGSPGYVWVPTIDGTELPLSPDAAAAAGQAASVPVLLGSNHDEGNLFTYFWTIAYGHDVTEDELKTALAILLDAQQIASVLAKYPIASYPGVPGQASVMLTNGLFECPARRFARSLSAHGNPTFLYQFKYAFSMPLLPNLGAPHSVELPFVFGTTLGGKNIGDTDRPMSNIVQGYWTRFATAGDPNGGGAAPWPKYDAAGDTNVVLDANITTGTALDRDACDFWDGIY